MTKIYCTVAIKLYYRQIERFWCLGDELPASWNETSLTAHQWYLPLDGVYQNKLSCGEIMDATFTDFTNIYKRSSCCVSCIFGPLTLVKGMSYKSTTKCFFFFFTVKPPHAPQPTILSLLTLYVYPTVSIAFFFPSSSPCLFRVPLVKMASTWLCHHHKAANHPAWACMISHVSRALVRIPMWGRVSLAARVNFSVFLLCGEFRGRDSGWLHAGLMVTKSHQ